MIFHSYVSLLEGILGLTCFSELFEVGHAWGFCPLLHVLYPSRLYITRAMSDTIISVHDWGLCAKSHSQNSDQFSCFFSVCRSHRKSKHPRIELDLAWTRTTLCTTRSPKRCTPHNWLNGWTLEVFHHRRDKVAPMIHTLIMSIPKHLLKFAPACILAY